MPTSKRRVSDVHQINSPNASRTPSLQKGGETLAKLFENSAGILVNTISGGDDTNTSDNEDKKTRAAFFLRILDCLDADVINSTDALRKGALYVRKSGRVRELHERKQHRFLFVRYFFEHGE